MKYMHFKKVIFYLNKILKKYQSIMYQDKSGFCITFRFYGGFVSWKGAKLKQTFFGSQYRKFTQWPFKPIYTYYPSLSFLAFYINLFKFTCVINKLSVCVSAWLYYINLGIISSEYRIRNYCVNHRAHYFFNFKTSHNFHFDTRE